MGGIGAMMVSYASHVDERGYGNRSILMCTVHMCTIQKILSPV
jgi:hypothetical protein